VDERRAKFKDGSQRRKVVGVMGGSTDYQKLTEPLGQLIASRGYHLLTGAGGGVMAGVAAAFRGARHEGLAIGIVRAADACDENKGQHDYAPDKRFSQANLDLAIFTHLQLSGAQGQSCHSRNHINVLTSDIVVALPGENGTHAEVKLAIKYGIPLVLYLGGAMINGHSAEQIRAANSKALIRIAEDIKHVDRFFDELL
jgi:predicted Rossmann-fold nucleotide-binding protein